jgi:hypothetical protein
MLHFIRNAIMCAAMSVLAVVVAWSVGVEAVSDSLPTSWSPGFREALALNGSVAIGVLVSAFALCFLLQSRHPTWWVLAYGLLWSFLALFPNLKWVTRSHAPSGIELGTVLVWGPLTVVFATLLALRLASIAGRVARPSATA